MMRRKIRKTLLLLLGTFLVCSASSNPSDEAGGLDPGQKVQLGRNIAWNQLEQHVRMGSVRLFKEDLARYNFAGFLQDKDSGYFEVLHAIMTRRPKQQSQQFLQPFLRTICSKNIVQLLPDLIGYFDLDSLLILRKYCPVGGASMNNLLEMFPEAQEGSPLARYLMESWDDPAALDHTRMPSKLSLIFSDMKGPSLDQSIFPRRFNREGFLEEGREMFQRLDKRIHTFQYNNLILFAEGMQRNDLVQVLAPLLRLMQNTRGAKGELRRLETWMDRFPGSLSMAVLADDKMHLWRRGAGSFVVISRGNEEGIEEALYPLGNAFKMPSSTLKYECVDVEPGTLLIYCSEGVTSRVHLHDILGSVLHCTEERQELDPALEMFFKHMLKERATPNHQSVIFRVFQVQPNEQRRISRLSVNNQQRRRSQRRFQIFTLEGLESHIDNSETRETRETRDSDLSLGNRVQAVRRRDPLWSLFLDSEASFDENSLLASSSEDGLVEETLFERRRWWAGEASETVDSSLGYDTSMSRDFFYKQPRTSSLDDTFSLFPPSEFSHRLQQSYE